MIRSRLIGAATAATLLTGGGLAGCGSSSSTTASTTPSPTPSGTDSPQVDQPGPGGDPTQMEAIRTCLTKAGISLPTPTGTPGDGNAPPPADAKTTGTPTTPPDGPGNAGVPFSDPKVIAALKACGITVPTDGPDSGAGGATAGTNSPG
jgi:hypothetical protein